MNYLQFNISTNELISLSNLMNFLKFGVVIISGGGEF